MMNMKNRALKMTTDDIPHYGEFKQFYFEKGAGTTFTLFIFYHPTPFGYEVIEHIEKEIKEGNRGYTIDGIYYDCPEHDLVVVLIERGTQNSKIQSK